MIDHLPPAIVPYSSAASVARPAFNRCCNILVHLPIGWPLILDSRESPNLTVLVLWRKLRLCGTAVGLYIHSTETAE